MSLDQKDLPLQLPVWAHAVLKAKAAQAGAKVSLKNYCEALLCRAAAKEAAEARYLAAQLDASGVAPKEYDRYRIGSNGGFSDSIFENNDGQR